MFRAQAMVCPLEPGLQVREDAVDRQEGLVGDLVISPDGDGMVAIADGAEALVAHPGARGDRGALLGSGPWRTSPAPSCHGGAPRRGAAGQRTVRSRASTAPATKTLSVRPRPFPSVRPPTKVPSTSTCQRLRPMQSRSGRTMASRSLCRTWNVVSHRLMPRRRWHCTPDSLGFRVVAKCAPQDHVRSGVRVRRMTGAGRQPRAGDNRRDSAGQTAAPGTDRARQPRHSDCTRSHPATTSSPDARRTQFRVGSSAETPGAPSRGLARHRGGKDRGFALGRQADRHSSTRRGDVRVAAASPRIGTPSCRYWCVLRDTAPGTAPTSARGFRPPGPRSRPAFLLSSGERSRSPSGRGPDSVCWGYARTGLLRNRGQGASLAALGRVASRTVKNARVQFGMSSDASTWRMSSRSAARICGLRTSGLVKRR